VSEYVYQFSVGPIDAAWNTSKPWVSSKTAQYCTIGKKRHMD